jgi:transglutaminase-like putative cysteine protease
LFASLTVASSLCAAVGGQVVADRGALPAPVGALAGAAVAALALLGLPSLSVRLVARLLVVVSGAVLVRFGVLTASLVSGNQWVVAWLVGAVAVFVLTDRIATDRQPGLGPSTSPAPPDATGRADGPGGGLADAPATARSVVAVAAAVVVFAVLAAPLALPYLIEPTSAGEGPRTGETEGAGTALRSTDTLDMTTRPDLTDEVMFTVDTDRGTFWRGETFDRWDGRRWTRSEPGRLPVAADGEVITLPDDLGADGDDVFTQRFRVEATYADVLLAAPSAVAVTSDRQVAQRDDGTLTTATGAMGRGASYSVTSRRFASSGEELRSADGGEVPAAVGDRYATEPEATDRVLEAATAITSDADTTYERIRAIEAWMGERTEYALDAPLSPEGVDVVDHFLFESRLGWCEQVASSLVVLARANDIPARLATGFVPSERDPVTGIYVVRAEDAHAWAEVWFPDVGWVPFDPTADVPPAGADRAGATLGRWLLDHAVLIGLGVVAVILVVGPLRALVGRQWRRHRDRPTSWAAVLDARLVTLGQRMERPRGGDESATAFATALARLLGEPRLVEVGATIDAALYAAVPPPPDRQARVTAVLDDLDRAERAGRGARSTERVEAGAAQGGARR